MFPKRVYCLRSLNQIDLHSLKLHYCCLAGAFATTVAVTFFISLTPLVITSLRLLLYPQVSHRY